MFTGIIETLGTVKEIKRSSRSFTLAVETDFGVLVMGESIAVNGTCLTVARIEGSVFYADATPETFERTSLKELSKGSFVNLERAMKADGRFGGHIVSGHVDGTGILSSLEKNENSVDVTITMPSDLGKNMIEKGSVTIDGISLTIASVKREPGVTSVKIAVIPHTFAVTTLGKKKSGDRVNIECDIIGKYIEHFVNFKEQKTQIDMSDFKSFH